MSDNQENNGNCKLRAYERNNYFYGKLMTVRDFELEQRYFNDKRWLINSLLYGSGTVCGLNVDIDSSAASITVKSGIAIDRCGHEIIVPEDINVELSDKDKPTETKKKAVYLSYLECPKERVRAQTASTCEEVCANNRTEESYEIDFRDVPDGEPEDSDEVLCGTWSNHETKTYAYPPGNEKIRFKRTVRKYVSKDDLLEVYLAITNLQNIQASVLIEDKFQPEGILSVIYGTNNLGQISIQAGETIHKMYVIKVSSNPPDSFSITANIDGNDINETKSVIEVKSPREISELLLNQLVDLWAKQPCFDGKDNTGIKIAELSLVTDAQGNKVADVDNTKRKLVYNNKYVTQMLECLRTQTSALENQSIKIKEKIAPGKILLSANPAEIDANGNDISTITITVQNDAGVGLSGIDVNLISTLGTLLNTLGNTSTNVTHVTTGQDGKVTVKLASGTTPGNATVMATTGAGAAVTQVKFNPTTGTIKGTITDKTDNNPIKGAIVAVGTITTVTDTDGNYSLLNVPHGNQVVWAFASGYNEATTVVDVKANQMNKTDFILTPIPTTGTIKGRVTDKEGKVIEKGATVTAGGITDTTDENGNYTLSNVPTGTHTVTASAEGYQIANRASVEVKSDEITSGIDFTLEPATGTIKGRVTAASATGIYERPGGVELLDIPGRVILPGILIPIPVGTGIKGATVSVVGTLLSAKTDDLGNYIIYNVPLGTQTVTAIAQDYKAGTKSVIVGANQTVTLDFQLTPLVTTGTITGRVTTLRGQSISICTAAVPTIIRSPTEGSILRPIESTIARTIVEPMPCMTGAPSAPCLAGNPNNVLCVAGAPSTPCLTGTPVTPSDEIGIAGATVSVAGTSLSAVTDGSGYYTIANVPAGMCTVTASAPKYNTGTQQVTVEAGKTVNANFQLTPAIAIGTISGRVTVAGTQCMAGSPVLICPSGGPDQPVCTGATPAVPSLRTEMPLVFPTGGIRAITATGIKGASISVVGTSLTAVTDDTGNYSIPNVPVGTYTVTASAPGYNTGTQSVTVNENMPITVNFQLTPLATNGEITGRVTNIEGIPISTATVTLVEDNISVITDANGFYKHSNALPGTHNMIVSASGYIDSTRIVNVIADQVTTADFVLNRAPCSAAMPSIICTAATPNIVTPICTAATPNIVTPICTTATPNIVTPICTSGAPNIITPICASGGPAIERPPVEGPVVERPTTVTPIVERSTTVTPVIERPILKRSGAGTACPSGRPTIAPKKDTKPQVKAKGGKK